MSDNINDTWLRLSKGFRISVVYSAMIILTLVILNILTAAYPWSLYPIFGVLWWPLSAYFAGRKQPFQYALCATGLLLVFFLSIYVFSSFGAHPWFIYPMLAVFWWPLSVWGAHAGAKKFSVVAAEYIILMVLTINLLTSPGYWWWIFPAVSVIWWPLAIWLHDKNKREGESK